MTLYQQQSLHFLQRENQALRQMLFGSLLQEGKEALQKQGWIVCIPDDVPMKPETTHSAAFQRAHLRFGMAESELPYCLEMALVFANGTMGIHVHRYTLEGAWTPKLIPEQSFPLFESVFEWSRVGRDPYEHWAEWMDRRGYTGMPLLNKTAELCVQITAHLEP